MAGALGINAMLIDRRDAYATGDGEHSKDTHEANGAAQVIDTDTASEHGDVVDTYRLPTDIHVAKHAALIVVTSRPKTTATLSRLVACSNYQENSATRSGNMPRTRPASSAFHRTTRHPKHALAFFP